MSEECRKVYSEVVGFLNCLPEEQYMKIPSNLIEYFKWHMDYSHVFEYNPEKRLDEQKISHDAKVVLLKIFNDYFANGEQKEKIKNVLIENERVAEAFKRKKYDPNNLF